MPRVSVALPVFQGERYLEAAIDALLAQTFEDFELWICDNASTDRTREIAEAAAARDPRVRYHRNDENIGAAPNFNRAFELTSGELFKWAAHDDLHDPRFLEACVAALDANPRAVLAYPRTQIIDEDGAPVEVYDAGLPTGSADASERFLSLLRGHKCFEVFGVFRRSAVERGGLIGGFAHGDGVLLARCALMGPFVEVPEPLFLARRHAAQSMRMIGDFQAYAVWFDPKHGGRMVFPQWRVHWEFAKAIARGPLSFAGRWRCLKGLSWWVGARRRILKGEVTYQVRRKLGLRQPSFGDGGA